MPTIICASRRASTCFFMNAPLPDLDVQHQRVDARRQLLRHDRRSDKRNRFHRRGGIAQRVQLAVRRGDLGSLADKRKAELGLAGP